MRAPSSAPEKSTTSLAASLPTPPLRRAVTLTRVGWIAVAILCLALLISSLPRRLAELAPLVTATVALRPRSLAIAPTLYIGGAFTLELISPIVYFSMAALIVWRRSDNPGAMSISALLLAFGAALPGTTYAIISATPIWRVAPGLLQALGWSSLLIFAYLFPDGVWVPRWSRLVVPLWIAWSFGFFVFAEPLLRGRPALILLSYLIWIIWLGTGVCAQVYRYLWRANPAQRQQSKWVLLGFIGALVGVLLVSAQQVVGLAQQRSSASSAFSIAFALTIMTLSTTLIPISIAIAILRHNLFDIDRLINLTLVYGVLTVLLGAIYAAVVGLSQLTIQAVTGRADEQQLTLVLSTLATATLFQPLRRRLQVAIDRQFYRRRYDAARTIEAFAASLRTEVDLNEITQRLVEVAHTTMKPRHASLWLAHPRRPQHPPEQAHQTKQGDSTAQ